MSANLSLENLPLEGKGKKRRNLPPPSSLSHSALTSPSARQEAGGSRDRRERKTNNPPPWGEPESESIANKQRTVIHQIFALLPPPTLASLRLTAPSLHAPATSSLHWRSHTLHLLSAHRALQDVSAVPIPVWSFSLVPDGWFRAYTTLFRIARTEWLWTDEQLKGSTWTVFFKAFSESGGNGPWHALVELRANLMSHPLEGLPLNISRWHVDGKPSLRCGLFP